MTRVCGLFFAFALGVGLDRMFDAGLQNAEAGGRVSSLPACSATNGDVNAVLVSGGALYVAGAFGQIGGATRARIARLDLSTGVAAAWNPAIALHTPSPMPPANCGSVAMEWLRKTSTVPVVGSACHQLP